MSTSAFLSALVNAYASALVTVSKTVGIDAEFLKADTSVGVNAPGSRVAALIGIVGAGAHGSAAVMADIGVFEAYVAAFSGGMIAADPEDAMAMSVLGELTNMISGQALIKVNIDGLDITPPQLIIGENLKTVVPVKGEIKSFTLPFKVGSGKVFLVLSVHGA